MNKRNIAVAVAVSGAALLGTLALKSKKPEVPKPVPAAVKHTGEAPYTCPSGLPSWTKPNNDC